MIDYLIEAVEPAYVTTDIEYKEDGTKEFITREQESTGMEDMPRYYRIIRKKDNKLLTEIENDYTTAEELLEMLINGEITDSEIQGMDEIQVIERVQEVKA